MASADKKFKLMMLGDAGVGKTSIARRFVDQVGRVRQVAVVQRDALAGGVRVFVDVIYPLGIEQGRPALDAVHFIAFLQQKFRQIGSILTGHAGDEGFFHRCSINTVRAGERSLGG